MDCDDTLFREERLQLILKMLLASKKVLVTDLINEFDVSASTVRLDLSELENRGLLKRTHGGAILPEKVDGELVTSKNLLALRSETQLIEKDAIAKAVVDLIDDGSSVMMDGGSTVTRVAQQMALKKKLTVITTSYHLLPILTEIPDMTIYVTGGLVNRDYKDLIGEISLDAISRFHPDVAIIGIDGVALKQGLTTTDISMAQIKKKMISLGKKVYFVADHSKFGKVCLVPVVSLDANITIVTDDLVDMNLIEQMRVTGTNIIVAGTEK